MNEPNEQQKFPLGKLRRKPFDKDVRHMLGGRAKADADAGLTMSRIETEYLAELVRIAGTVVFPAFAAKKN